MPYSLLYLKSKMDDQKLQSEYYKKFSSNPSTDENYLNYDNTMIVIQINGKVKDKVEVKSDISQEELEKIVFHREKIKAIIADRKIKKVIYIQNKILSIVI